MISGLLVATVTNVPSALIIATLTRHAPISPAILPVYASQALPAMVLPAWTLTSVFRAMAVVTRLLNVPIQLARAPVAPALPAMAAREKMDATTLMNVALAPTIATPMLHALIPRVAFPAFATLVLGVME